MANDADKAGQVRPKARSWSDPVRAMTRILAPAEPKPLPPPGFRGRDKIVDCALYVEGVRQPGEWTPQTNFGMDGGAHNLLRQLEAWSTSTAINYRGSIVSFYYSRQAIGTFKCCNDTYTPGDRNYFFDTDFLLPDKLPPGTPMFRDVNTLTFRQLLRPNQ